MCQTAMSALGWELPLDAFHTSGAGKSREMNQLFTKFGASGSLLSSGKPTKMVKCVLDRKDGWKSLGVKTLEAMDFDFNDKARITQTAIWKLVAK